MSGPVTKKVSELRTLPTLEGLWVKSSMIQVYFQVYIGDGVQMSVSSLETTFVKLTLPLMVIFHVKTAPVLHLWWWIPGGMGGILTPGDGVNMSVSSLGTTF